MHCSQCGNSLEPGTRFCPACGAAVAGFASGASAGTPPPFPGSAAPRSTTLLRPREGRVIAGVCAAFALQFGWDVILVRVLFAVFTVVTGFVIGVVAYLVAWLIIPDAPFVLPVQSR